MQIKQQIIPKSRKTQRPGIAMTPQFITIHSTGNPSSTAQNEADYVCKNSVRQASFHFVCDEKQIIQALPTNEIACTPETAAAVQEIGKVSQSKSARAENGSRQYRMPFGSPKS